MTDQLVIPIVDDEPDESAMFFRRCSQAVKNHGPCEHCRNDILPGQTYIRYSWPGGSRKLHMVCEFYGW